MTLYGEAIVMLERASYRGHWFEFRARRIWISPLISGIENKVS